MTAQPTTGRLILAGKAALPDNPTPEPWTPPVLLTGPIAEPLVLTLPQEPEPPQKSQHTETSPPHETVPISPNDTLEQIATNKPSDVAQAIRTVLLQGQNGNEAQKKVAVLLLGLGTNLSANVLHHCTEEDIQVATHTIIELEGVTAREKDAICEEFRQILIAGDYVLRAGKDYVREMLQRAFSFSKAQRILNQATGQPTSGFAMLNTVEASQIVPFISQEHPQTIALILSQLAPEKAASVLNGLYPQIQIAVMERLVKMDNISPRVLQELEGSLANELQAILSSQITQIGGPKIVGRILNHAGRTIEKNIIENLEKKYPKLVAQIRNHMFVFDDIAKLTDREIQTLLKETDTRNLAIALKGGSKELQERIFANLSEEAAAKIKEEMQYSGPVRMSDVEETQLCIVQHVRQLEEQGQISIVRSATDVFI